MIQHYKKNRPDTRYSPPYTGKRCFILAVLLLFLLSIAACRPVPQTTGTSDQVSSPADTTTGETSDPGTSATEQTTSETDTATTDNETATDEATTGDETATDVTATGGTTGDEITQPGTSGGHTSTIQSTTTITPTRTTSSTTTARTTTTTARTTTTTTARTTTTTTTARTTTTTTTTQAQPATNNFPYKNYGAFFRDDYGRSNSQITEAHSGQVRLDVGSAPNGVVLVRVSTSIIGSKECIVVMSKDGQSYQYTVPDRDRYAGIPLNMGNGQYSIMIIEATPVARSGGGYDLVGTVLMNHSFSVSLSSSLKPFTASSVKNDFSRGSAFVQKANELTSGITSADGKVSAVYSWIVANIKYDADLARRVNDANLNNEYITHVADPARTYSSRKGICDDYAALMSAMLRSQGIPTRIIYGHVTLGGDRLYHAWNEVFFEGKGWVVVASFSWKQIDGSSWVRFDSTFAASGSSPESIRDRNPPREKIY